MSNTTTVSSIQAYGTTEPGLNFKELTIPITRPLRDDEVLLRVLCTGVCHSDLHLSDNDWSGLGVQFFDQPNAKHLVPGHEVISRVIAKGKDVTNLSLGDRVGCGPIRNTCGTCQNCTSGFDQLCLKSTEGLFSATETGGFGSYMMVPSNWCFVIPESLPTREAAPLLCAGLTTFSPLYHSNLPKGSKVGVLGLGGLGLMAVRYSIAMGYDTYAFSTSPDKREYLLSIGCKDVLLYRSNPELLQSHYSSFNFILNTVSATIDANLMLMLLAPRGELCYCGLGPDPLSANPFLLVGANKKITGSYVGSNQDMIEMLKFSAEHQIYPLIEVAEVPFCCGKHDVVNEQIQRVSDGLVRYRLVLDYQVDDATLVESVSKTPHHEYVVQHTPPSTDE